MAAFFRPETKEEALKLLGTQDGAVFFAGGTEIERLNGGVSASALVSLEKLGLKGVAHEGGDLAIGAMTTFTEALASPLVPEGLKQALRFMGSLPKRNMATIGGNIARGEGDSYLVPTLVAFHARLVLATGADEETTVCVGRYTLHRKDYGRALITKVLLPLDRWVASKRFSNTMESHAAVTVALGCRRDAEDLHLAAAVRPDGIQIFRATQAALSAGGMDRAAFHASLAGELRTSDDFTGSAGYKAYLVEEALWELWEQYGKEAKA